MSMNPRETTEKIRSDYQEYIASILNVRDPEIATLARDTVNETEFVKGPYLEITLPFKKAHSLKELAGEGLVSREFSKMGKNVHYSDWQLHVHQEDALRKIIQEEKNIVVSTGTGSGKTECYLYPIINSLMREKEAGTLGPGVRALLLFPMNALANDQQKKLRKLLREYPDITFGRYTGETDHKREKETVRQAEHRMHEEYDNEHAADTDKELRKSIPNELMCREMMAQQPPHILLTNYAMLEYLLLQPNTAPFFDTSFADNWRFIVIDEAHTYKGADGTEIAFLLRRLKERIRHHMDKPFRCIATSATLGNKNGKKDLAAFAEELFGEPFDENDVITTERDLRPKPANGRYFQPREYAALKEAVQVKPAAERGPFLYNELLDDLRLYSIYKELERQPKRIEEVASSIFFDLQDERVKERSLIDLIELAAAAQRSENEAALLPARYHLFVKSLEGMFVQLYPSKKVFLDRKEAVRDGNRTYSVFELANCQKCEQEYLVGNVMSKQGKEYLVQTNNTEKPEYFFASSNDDSALNIFDEDDNSEEANKLTSLKKYHLCLCCGRITPFAESLADSCCTGDDSKIITVYNLKYSGKEHESNCCPCCGATRQGLIKRFLTANQPATFAVAKSLYDAIPPRPQEEKQEDFFDDIFAEIDSDDLFGEANPAEVATNTIKDESGRKLLIFSDNRQEAAFFAGFFENKYNLLMWRKTILKCLEDEPTHTLTITDLITKAVNTAEKSGLYSFDQERYAYMTDGQKREMAAHYVMQEFLHPEIQTKLEGLGYITIEPEELTINAGVERAGLQGKDLWNVLRYMMDTLRQKGAVSFPEEIRATDDFFEPRNHYAYFGKMGTKKNHAGHVIGFIPSEKAINKRLGLMLKLEKDTEDPEKKEQNARSHLEEIYKLITSLKNRGYLLDVKDTGMGICYCLNHEKWRFRLVKSEQTLYRCNRCKNVFGYSIRGLCPEMKCDGVMEAVGAEKIQKTPYYYQQYNDKKLIPMMAREHTAQLSAETAGKYQKSFEEGKINVLSCSTTFEMGVDVGELEATFLRNVPPETSNYIQRAGRAGRRTSSAAFSVTFSRRNSHDMTFFHEPAQIISGNISSPVLEIDNEKIAERHLNSIIVAWFFKQFPEYFLENTKKVVSYGDDENNMRTTLSKELGCHPRELLQSIEAVFPEKVCTSLNVADWAFVDNLVGGEGSLTKAIEARKADIAGLKKYAEESKNELDSKKGLGQALVAEKLITTLESETSINFLSAKGVLPKYGFPIDSVTLDVISGNEIEAKKIDLNRDLKMAISEFAPPSQIVANGKVWKSYAVNTVPSKSWPTYVYYECPVCKRINPPVGGMVDVSIDLEEVGTRNCDFCGTLMNARKFIVPIFGFSTKMGEKPKRVGDTKPSTYYITQTQFWGIDDLTEKQKAEARDETLTIRGKRLEITYSPGGKLFVLNQGTNRSGLSICPSCGYATDMASALRTKKHDTKYGRPCSNRLLERVSLGHEFSTDILKIQLPEHIIDLELPAGVPKKNQARSILYAILEGASAALDISRDDIDGCVVGQNELVLYDDTAGGSGFVKHIFNNIEKVLKKAKEKVSGVCGCTEETSCYGCLRNYSNQLFHDEISRGLAFYYLDWLINSEPELVAPPEPVIIVEPFSEEPIGKKESRYEAPDTSTNDDTVTAIESMLKNTVDEKVIAGLQRLLDHAYGKRLEKPIKDDYIPVESNIWPELFWGKSHVALFTAENERQYRILKKYDWYCYILDDNINPNIVLSHIVEGD